MGVGTFIDGLIEPLSPALARKRIAQRMALQQVRQYEAAGWGRRTQGWNRPSTSASTEVGGGLIRLRDGSRDMIRNNKYAASFRRQIVANLWGDGISPRAQHLDPKVAKAAQVSWDGWANGRVDGRNDWYGVGKIVVSAMVEGGEGLNYWSAGNDGYPYGRCEALEADFLDLSKTSFGDSSPRIVQGVEFKPNGDRAAYWLFDAHPGDYSSSYTQSKRVDASVIDHVYETVRAGQVRGVPWLAPVLMTLRDLADYEDALLMKRKVEACLALVLEQPDEIVSSANNGTDVPPDDPGIETLRPGAILRMKAGQKATVVNPSAGGGDGLDFVRQQLAAISANSVPNHLLTGDVSQANYSSLRAALLGFWANLDDWQQNVLIPLLCAPAFERRMRTLAFQTGDKRFLQVTASWAPPPRRFVDPLKDVLGEVAEVRAGFKAMEQSLSERGLNIEEHFAQIAKANRLIDQNGLALETDPRRLTDNGMLQVATGYVLPKGGGASEDAQPNTPVAKPN